jgi:NAD(P)-dependent dehydrogenase (short-subunit alcohol dehydrogenase family)
MHSSKNRETIAAVTGSTGAIGFAIAKLLAQQGYEVILITRDPDKSSHVVSEIIAETNNPKVRYELVDLSSMASIQSLASRWRGPLHILINNAAISPRNRVETDKGIEMQFATNVLGYFWMTKYFTEILADSSPARVINVASYWAGGLDINDLEFKQRLYHNHDAYRQSKQANRMLTPVFASLLNSKDITVNACHPGDVNSSLSNSLGFGGSQSPEFGAETPVWLSTEKSLSTITGKYFEHCQETHCPFSLHTETAQQLYEICQNYK